ncbi:MAG TPA: APH(3') family aminoglycoside O-phosphotransferase [Actinomycetota bacterium]
MSRALTPVAPPPEVLSDHEGWDCELAWSLVPQAATWRLTRGSEARYVKVARVGREPSLPAERVRLEWAAGRLPVPTVLDGGTVDGVDWLLLAGLPGRDATVHPLREEPARLVPILARALRTLHEAPIDDCPFDFRLDAALAKVRQRVRDELVVPATDFPEELQHLTAQAALEWLESDRPDTEDVVLCHGDYCLPNVLFNESGGLIGYLDLGKLGLADRWWDLAVATWSVTWNLGPGWEDLFLDAYGAARDPAREAYYRLMYNVVS